MHPRQMVAFAVVFYGELPVGVYGEGKLAIDTAVKNGFFDLCPTFEEIGVDFFKGGGVARDIDKDHIAPDVASDLDEAQL